MKKTYVFLADGFEEIEGLTVVDLLRRAGVEVQTVSIKDTKEIQGSHGITLFADSVFAECNFDDAELLVLPGGMPGTKNLGAFEPLCELLKKFDAAGRKIAAICAAPSVFASLGILKGRKATSYPSFMEMIAENGADAVEESVVVDGHVITSRGMGTAIDFSLTLIEQLIDTEKKEQIAASIVYK
ncbi:MAG: DJ-1/PfpI family protein [Eubacteriales bacterium]|nr:DJ-1/PfpI family protein [Eubacteriales bacterium]